MGFLLPCATAEAETFAERVRRAALEQIERQHLEACADAEKATQEALAAGERGMSQARVLAAIPDAVRSCVRDLRPVGGRPDPAAVYRLPFPRWPPWLVFQGNGGKISHFEGASRFAFDFALAPGTPVLAARKGRVAGLIDGFPPGTELPSDVPGGRRNHSNAVFVVHEDGTVAEYGYLRKGIVVRPGQTVKAGQLLAYSGASGIDRDPHLHFHVDRRDALGTTHAVPIRFGRGFVPKEGDVVGAGPKANTELRVRVGQTPLPANRRIVLPRGASAQLRVEAKIGGTYREITASPQVRYHSITPWSLVAEDGGRIRMAGAPGYETSHDENRDAARFMVLYAEPKTKRFGQIAIDVSTK